ncbi:MAG: DMT family transporter [Proteobacteria bacterium]|nr:DMT family transporter [Pseudomonadota bacterium]MDA1181120.1 DMT family transporter [Pseudomonadota bacterium]
MVKNNLFLAVVLSLSGLFLLDCMGIAIKYLREDYPAAQLSVFRNLFGMIPCFIVLYFSKDWHANGRKVVIKRWRFGLARGLIMSFAQLCLYTSYLYLPYALVATMEYTGPMMITLLAIPLLGEKFGWYKSLAVLTGFIGIIFIMQPWSESFNFYMLLPVMAAFGYSIARVTSLNFSNDTPVPLINLYANIGTLICAILLVITFNMWENFKSLFDLLILFIMGIAGGSGVMLLIYGSRKAELSKIMPFDYIEIFFALILGWVFFREWPVDQLFPGALFIVAGGIIIYLRQMNSLETRDRKV